MVQVAEDRAVVLLFRVQHGAGMHVTASGPPAEQKGCTVQLSTRPDRHTDSLDVWVGTDAHRLFKGQGLLSQQRFKHQHRAVADTQCAMLPDLLHT